MEIVCPACNRKMQSAKDLSGRNVKCKCGHSFRVPSQPATANSSGKITLKCECGKTLAVPASAAGKQAKCTCGRILNVPGSKAQLAPAAQSASKAKTPRAQQTTLSPLAGAFNSISEDEWSKLTVDTAPKQADPYADLLPPEEEEEKRTAADEIMDRAREEMGESKDGQKDQAVSQLSSARWLLIFVGALNIGFAVFEWFQIKKAVDELGLEGEALETLLLIAKVLVGVEAGIGVLFCLFGAFIFTFPLTCTISATVLYIGTQILSLILNPLKLANIAGWIVRVSICGALIKAINNAAYYNYLKKQQKQKGRKQVGY